MIETSAVLMQTPEWNVETLGCVIIMRSSLTERCTGVWHVESAM